MAFSDYARPTWKKKIYAALPFHYSSLHAHGLQLAASRMMPQLAAHFSFIIHYDDFAALFAITFVFRTD